MAAGRVPLLVLVLVVTVVADSAAAAEPPLVAAAVLSTAASTSSTPVTRVTSVTPVTAASVEPASGSVGPPGAVTEGPAAVPGATGDPAAAAAAPELSPADDAVTPPADPPPSPPSPPEQEDQDQPEDESTTNELTPVPPGTDTDTDTAVEVHEEATNSVTSPCGASTCGPHGLCVSTSSKRHSCVCVEGAERVPDADGRRTCQRTTLPPVLPCLLHCSGRGHCRPGSDGPKCVCKPPYAGDQCERDRCAGHCANKGHCYQNLLNGTDLACNCRIGWTGERCEQPVDPCAGTGCLNGATCRRTNGTDTCLCPAGFTGRLCEQCQDHVCHGNSTCQRDPHTTQPTCLCAPGLSGPHCETGNCSTQLCHSGTCTMKKGEPKCTCTPGYGGVYCQIDLCHLYCKNGGTCVPTAAGLRCDCRPRYGGRRCEVDLCTCSPGCRSDDCIGCPPGSSRPDYLCGGVLPFSCSDGSLLCLNGGTCRDVDGHAHCRCAGGYSGVHCEVAPAGGAAPACRPGVCLHGASCDETAAGARCVCLPGWTGRRCGEPTSCRHYCFNGATCQPAAASARDQLPTCHCAAGYIGLRCSTPVSSVAGGRSAGGPSSLLTGGLVALGLLMFILLIAAGVVVWRKRHGKPFSHTRMRSDKLEVDNPMYLRDLEARDEAEDVEDAVFSLEDKPTNFSNPVYESTYPERDGASSSSEKANLLPPENGRPALTFSGTAPTDPLQETDA